MASSKNKLVICWGVDEEQVTVPVVSLSFDKHLLLVGNHNGQTKPAMRAQVKRSAPAAREVLCCASSSSSAEDVSAPVLDALR